MWRIDDSELLKLERELLNQGRTIDKYYARFKIRLLDIYKKHAIREAPRGKTGKFKAAHRANWTGNTGNIYIDPHIAPYGDIVLKGSRPHMIFPKHKKALYWEGAGHPWKHVHHPGTKPNRYPEKAVLKASPEMYRLSQEFVNMIVVVRL